MEQHEEKEIKKYEQLLKNNVQLLVYTLMEQNYGKKSTDIIIKNEYEDLEELIKELCERIMSEINISVDELQYYFDELMNKNE